MVIVSEGEGLLRASVVGPEVEGGALLGAAVGVCLTALTLNRVGNSVSSVGIMIGFWDGLRLVGNWVLPLVLQLGSLC